MTIRLYRITLSTGSLYDKADQQARSFEGHFRASLRGSIRTNRKRLAGFLVPIFRRQVYRELAVRISPSRIRIGFEREQAALSPGKELSAEFLVITYHGKQHVAKRLTPQAFSLVKSRRRSRKRQVHRATKAKRRKIRTKTRPRRIGKTRTGQRRRRG
jgi:hypothetical protein